MLDAVRAEALKLHRHRATWLMVWIYPVLITVLVIGLLIYGGVKAPSAPEKVKTAAEWIRSSALLWNFPTSAPGRFLIAGFCAVVFAGEYGWNTWKLIIPARVRWQLIAAKWVVALGLVMISLIAADLIGMLGDWLQTFQGDKIPEGVTAAAVFQAHAKAAAYALFPIVYTIAFAGMFAVLTQSVLATVILSIAIVVLEGMTPLISLFAYRYVPGATVMLVKTLPFFHQANLSMSAKGVTTGLTLPLGPADIITATWWTSFAVLAAWIVAALAVTQLRFARQDLN